MAFVNTTQVASSTPFDNATNGFVSTDVQAAIEEARAFLSTPTLDQDYYVSKGGSDTSGNGSIGYPYLTIAKAMSMITDSSVTKRYVITVGPGDYNENIVLKANVFVKGSGPISTRLTGTTLSINDATWNVAGDDNRSGFMDMSVNPTCTWDFNAQTNNTAGKLYFFNIRTSGAWTATANNSSSGINQLIMHDSQIFGAITSTGCNTSIQDSTIQGVTMTVLSGTVAGQGNAGMTIAGGSTTGNLVATWTSNGTVSMTLRGLSTSATTTITASGASCTVSCAPDSLPVPANRTFTSSAVLVRLNDNYAQGLRSATTNVDASAATAPTAGQALVATSSTVAVWSSVSSLVSNEITSAGNNTTTSGTDAQMTAMTTTPAAGTYLVLFNTDVNSSAAGATISVSYYLAGVQIAVTLRKVIPFDGGTLSALAARGMATLQAIITVTGSQAITVQWSTSGGTATSANRSLITLRVA